MNQVSQSKTKGAVAASAGITPPPWTYRNCPCGHPSCDKFIISSAWAEGMFIEPDARLIVAGHDLLEACRVSLSYFEIEKSDWAITAQLKAAITKAVGSQ